MASILTDLKNTIIAGVVLAIVLVLILMGAHGEGYSNTHEWWAFFLRWLHVLSGVMWIHHAGLQQQIQIIAKAACAAETVCS